MISLGPSEFNLFPTKKSNLTFLIGTDSILESHDPIIIEKDKLGHDPENPDDYTPEEKNNLIPGQVDACCDKIHFVYDWLFRPRQHVAKILRSLSSVTS